MRLGREFDPDDGALGAVAHVHDVHQMPDLEEHASDGRRIGSFYHLLHVAKTQSADGLPHASRTSNEAAHPLDSQHP